MSAEEMFRRYVEEHRAGGEADPVAYLREAPAGQRRELAALIDAYLESAPRASFDEQAFRGSPSEATVEALERSLGGQAGMWPALLPRLRDRAGLKRRELVEGLSRALGLGGREQKVGAYYHEMEQGLLPSEGVSARVLEALAGLLGASADELRDAGRSLGAGALPGPGGASVFARSAPADGFAAPPPAGAAEMAGQEAVADLGAFASPGGWDEVDELFRGNQA